jgi:hypothetical protein
MLDEPPSKINKPLIGVAMVVVIAAVGGWLYWHSHSATPPAAPAVVAEPPAAAAVPPDTIAHPLPATAGRDSAPLPELRDSDGLFEAALGAAAGSTDLTQYLVPTDLIRHIVVTVDNLPRQRAAVEKRPTTPVPGSFIADGDELHATLDARNFKRYQPMVGALENVDMQRLVAVYLHFYPLFQKAYQDLGYPNGYFNDRLVQVIDDLLATPQVSAPIELVRPNVMYVFADPALEARSAGQKILIRLGPDSTTAVKGKLMELRAAITAAAPKPSP